ncbi:hypothetical protein [Streptomyces sp. NPDC101234]|uniref:hypothetical protein n=1 Tax=Streptomyces sp. NPDC101234 TaxID=3366138 RepID=UPI003809A74D
MGTQEIARTELARRLADRTRALGDHLQQRETPVASSASDLVLRELPTPPEGSVDEIMALYPVPDGDFVLTDRTLYYRDKRGNVYLLPLASIATWRQKRTEYYDHLPSRIRRRILEIDIRTSDGTQYLIETGKIFAKGCPVRRASTDGGRAQAYKSVAGGTAVRDDREGTAPFFSPHLPELVPVISGAVPC